MTRAADLVEQEAAALAALLAPGTLDAQVPGCPGWGLVDLVRHTGGVHRWATAALATAPDGDPGGEPTGPDDGAAVRSWFLDGARALAAALRATSPTQPCWTFAAPEAPATAAFWARRQVLETALHRWDAEAAVAAAGLGAAPDPAAWLAAEVAADGVREVAEVVAPRQVRLGRTPVLPGVVSLQDADGRGALLGSTGPAGQTGQTGQTEPAEAAGRADAVVTGPSPALLLLLWRRTSLEHELDAGRRRLTGDRTTAERVLAAALTP